MPAETSHGRWPSPLERQTMAPPDFFPAPRAYGLRSPDEGGAVIVNLVERRGAEARSSVRSPVHADVAHFRDYVVRPKVPARERRALPRGADLAAALLADPDSVTALDTLLHQHIELHLDMLAAGCMAQGEVAENIRRSV